MNGEVNGVFIYNGKPQNGATAQLWKITGFAAYADSTDEVESNPLEAVDIELAVNDETLFAVGDVIKIVDELLRITHIEVDLLYVIRGYRGTAPIQHVQNTQIDDETITEPAQDTAVPAGSQQGGDVTTGVTYGGDGAYRWTAVPEGEYYVSVTYDGHIAWLYASVETNDPTPEQILTDDGDIMIRNADSPTRLAKGTQTYLLTMGIDRPSWVAPSSGAGGLSVFGDGTDGNITISGDTDLTKDMFYLNLTVDNTFTLSTKGYRIFVKNTLTNNGTIERAGNNGVGVTGGVAHSAATLGGSGAGRDGNFKGSGGGGGGGGVVVIAAKDIINTSGVLSVKGGNGADAPADSNGTADTNGTGGSDLGLGWGGIGGKGSDKDGQTGGAGAIITVVSRSGMASLVTALLGLETESVSGLIGGGAGGGSGVCKDAGGIVAHGGGGGGGGGVLVLIYNATAWGTETADGGSYGTGGTNGANGAAGKVIKIANA